MSKEALVVPRDILFGENHFQGFVPATEKDFLQTILKNYNYHLRGDELENNYQLQQIIPYIWIVNRQEKKVFAYRRAPNKNYTEKRLRNKWSCGLGGHIERQDKENPIISAALRELSEEVKIKNYSQLKIVGYLNDDSNEVGKVHFGVVVITETTHSVEKGDDEMAECKLLTIKEFESLLSNQDVDIETWTKLSWPFVKDYLLNN